MEGDFAPPFTLKDLRGKDVSLGDYKGKYLLINFWATWCTPCKIEMQSIEELYQRFRLEKFDVLAISNDMFGERVVKSYIKNRGFTFTVLLDPILTVSKQFGVVSLPTTFLVDPKGKVIGVLGGAEDWSAPRNIAFFQTLLDSEPEG
ncbi:MAG: TlpA disulfide reductase family protein [Nitrospinota bacterium]|nr:TlpA disulfide reductase family protein [Nitrospinota bacterium]